MTYHGGSWLLQTVESNAIGAAVGAIVGGTVSYLYKRAVRLEAVRIERTLAILEHIVGGTTAAIPIIAQKGTMTIQLSQYRKGIAAGLGVMLTGALTWAESADLEPVLGPLVPEPFRPLVGVFLGGVALTASVILTANTPKKSTSTSTPATAQPVLAPRSSSSSSTSAASLASLVAGVAAGATALTSETSVVKLLDPPTKTYQ